MENLQHKKIARKNQAYFAKRLNIAIAFASGRLKMRASSLVVDCNEKSHSFHGKDGQLLTHL
jgi:hypothetical protein